MMKRVIIILLAVLTGCGTLTNEQARTSPTARPSVDQLQPVAVPPTLNQERKETRPSDVERCLEKPEVKNAVDPRTDKKVNYLKGDFDGDSLPDYAVAVKGRKSRRNGVLICHGQGGAVILGADNPVDPPFSDMPHDNFVAPKWEVYTKEQALELGDAEHDAPERMASPRGDSIAMIWEDGVCLIYWDGSRYRWGCGQ
jgi:hypothetical protein